VKVVQDLILLLSLFVLGFFLFAGSVYVKVVVESYYFLQLVVLMSILFVSSLLLMGESAFC